MNTDDELLEEPDDDCESLDDATELDCDPLEDSETDEERLDDSTADDEDAELDDDDDDELNSELLDDAEDAEDKLLDELLDDTVGSSEAHTSLFVASELFAVVGMRSSSIVTSLSIQIPAAASASVNVCEYVTVTVLVSTSMSPSGPLASLLPRLSQVTTVPAPEQLAGNGPRSRAIDGFSVITTVSPVPMSSGPTLVTVIVHVTVSPWTGVKLSGTFTTCRS